MSVYGNSTDDLSLRGRVAELERRLERIVHASPIGVALLDAEGRVREANDVALGLLGYRRADLTTTCLRLDEITPGKFHALDVRARQDLATRGSFEPYEKKLVRKDGELASVVVAGARLADAEKSHANASVVEPQSVIFLLDIAERKATEEALARSEEKFRILARNVPGVVYLCDNDEQYTMLYLSEGVKELTGFSARRFLNDKLSFTSLYHPDDAQHIRPQVSLALAENEQFHLVYRLRHAEGGWRWVEELGQGVFDEQGQLRFLEGTLFDITQRKLAEDALRNAHAELEQRVADRTRELQSSNERLRREVTERRRAEQRLLAERELLLKTIELHENHRKLVSYEIHDGVAAYVFAALMHLETYRHRQDLPLAATSAADDDDEIQNDARLELAIGLLKKTNAEARRLISGLRPPILDESGIVAAIDYLIQEQASFADKIEFEHELADDRFAALLESAVFRIVQEALTNIVKHSRAKRAKITLTQRRGRLELKIRDWGRGFVVEDVDERRYGLQGIRERASLLGGLATIESSPRKGTRITVDLPVLPREPDHATDASTVDGDTRSFDEEQAR